MSGLIIKLGPKERILINGAVIENGDRRSRINILTANANILRLKDAIHPKDANTPVRRACYLAQLILSGDVDQMSTWDRLSGQTQTLASIFIDNKSASTLDQIRISISEKDAYSCLKLFRRLLPLEVQLLREDPRWLSNQSY